VDEMAVAGKLDAVYVYGDNCGGAEEGVKALERGWHVLIEKPMAADLAGADALLQAAEKSGRRLMVNWPFAWWPQLQHAIALAQSGRLGELWQVRYRAAHQGPREVGCSEYFCEWLYDPRRNGGGALMDYCCYGANLASVLLGRPESVTGLSGNLCKRDLEVEDNAVVLMQYPRALAVAEASWTQIGNLTAYSTVLYGTKGTLLVEPGDTGSLLLATADNPDGAAVSVPKSLTHLLNATSHFLWGIETGESFLPLCCPYPCRDAQEILAAGAQSAATGRRVALLAPFGRD